MLLGSLIPQCSDGAVRHSEEDLLGDATGGGKMMLECEPEKSIVYVGYCASTVA